MKKLFQAIFLMATTTATVYGVIGLLNFATPKVAELLHVEFTV